MALFLTLCAAILMIGLVFAGAPFWAWSLALGAVFVLLDAPVWAWVLFGVPVLFFNIIPLRRALLTAPIVRFMKARAFLPSISKTERIAIEAGNIWVDGDLFSGKPDFARILKVPAASLSPAEQTFYDNQVETLCTMTQDWDIYAKRDFSAEIWAYLKKERFFGLVIPEKYGGHGFSATGHSTIVSKIASRSVPLGITVMVPNSLGPAELLTHYGTDAQKDHYLPRLARGEEIPCFALTEAGAGSDAGAMTSSGDVFRDADGELKLRLNWNKRYITLASIATVLGLAFKLRDPENLLGKGRNPGITCALIPTDSEGVDVGERHDPLGVPFINSPTSGRDVVVPVDAIIGGPEQAGNGWRMLMESLAVGRGISLPSTAAGSSLLVSRAVGAYARIRRQFGLAIGKFGGIEEPLARIGGFTYIIESIRRFTCSGLDHGEKPAVITAIAKFNATELGRKVINDAMDILGGAGISRGPRNLLAHIYFSTPVSITVEGANILTRTLMIFGQGAIRCHPWALKEIDALQADDLVAFDRAFWGHVGHVMRNGVRAVLLSLSRGWLARSPVSGSMAQYHRKMAWASSSFAVLADLAMALYGGNLKRKEKLTGRFSDVFSWMYLGSATLHRFEAEGRKAEDAPVVEWALQYAFAQMQSAFEGIADNLGRTWFTPLAIWSRLNPIGRPPSDRLGAKLAKILQTPGEQRDALTAGIFLPQSKNEALGRLEHAFELTARAEIIEKQLKDAVRDGKLEATPRKTLVTRAVEERVISSEEARLLATAEAARNEAIQVDSFSSEEYLDGVPAAEKNAKQRKTFAMAS